jgi:tetratricopeptide (TPR) repeat protein
VPRLADARARLAAFDSADGNLEAARAALDRAIEDDPATVEARLLRAGLILGDRTPDLDGALRDADRANELAPRDPRPAYARGKVLAARGSWAEAAIELERGLELARDARGRAPDDKGYREALRLAGEARLRSGDSRNLEQAETDLEEAIRLEPDIPQPRILLGKTLLARKRDALAVEAFSDALRRAPEDGLALELRAQALRGIGRARDALADLDAALAQRPRVRFLRGLILGETPAASGGEELAFDLDGAKEDLLFSLGADAPGRPPSLPFLDAAESTRARVALGWIELASGEATPARVARAVAQFDAALSLSPGDRAIRLARGLVLLRGSHPDRAREDLEAARARPELAYSALVGLAKLVLAEHGLKDALARADEACALAPTRPEAHALRRRIAALAGDLATEPKSAEPSSLRERLDQDERAAAVDAGAEARGPARGALRPPLFDVADPLEAAERAAARGLEAFAGAVRSKGRESPSKGEIATQLAQACAYLKRALVLDPDRAAVALKLGDVLYVLGRPKEAWASYGRALELDPTLVEAHVVRGILERDFLFEREPARAVTTLEGALALLEKVGPPLDPLLGARALYELARARDAAGDLEKALAACEESCRITPERHAPNALRARLLFRLKRPEADRALELAAKLLHRPPDASEHDRAVLFFRAGELAEDPRAAEHFYTRAIEATPTLAAAWRRRGERSFKSSPLEFPSAFVDLAESIELDRSNQDSLLSVEGKIHRFRAIAAELDDPVPEFLTKFPDLPASYFLAGFWALHERGDPELAEERLTQALHLSPDWDAPLAYRALARARRRDLEGASHDIERARALDPKNAVTAFFAACVSLSRNDAEGCYRELDEAVGLGFKFADRIRSAPELASLSGEPRFEKLLERLGETDGPKKRVR